MVFAVQSAIGYLFWFLAIVAFAVEVWALIDAARTPDGAFTSAGKLDKTKWLLILGMANVVGLGGAAAVLSLLSFLPIIAFIAAAVYMADVRPAVTPYRKGGGGRSGRSGPYGPW